MRLNVRLLMAVVICCLFKTIQCFCLSSGTSVHRFDLFDARHSIRSGKLFASEWSFSQVHHLPQNRCTNSRITYPMTSPFVRLAELTPDDEDQAGDSQSNSDDMEFARLQPFHWAGARRLNQFDALSLDSFIHSKTRPPPRKQRSTKT
jgi:hypothetical protein